MTYRLVLGTRALTNIQSLPQQVFLWIGAEANVTEKESALATAQEYLHTHPSGRDADTPILIIKQGFEPPTFTGWFLAWDSRIWSVRTGGGGDGADILTARDISINSSVGRRGTRRLSKPRTTCPPSPSPLPAYFSSLSTHHSTKSS